MPNALELLKEWYEEYPWEQAREELAVPGDYNCYACGVGTHIEYDTTQPEWWEARPEADEGHHDDCIWVKTKQFLSTGGEGNARDTD